MCGGAPALAEPFPADDAPPEVAPEPEAPPEPDVGPEPEVGPAPPSPVWPPLIPLTPPTPPATPLGERDSAPPEHAQAHNAQETIEYWSSDFKLSPITSGASPHE